MNLMFRKNFHDGGGGKFSGGSKLQAKANRSKRSRGDVGLTQTEDIHYRTHLFFSPSRTGTDVGEERCSAFSASTQLTTPALMSQEVEAPQPLVDRKHSVSLLRWNTMGIHPTASTNAVTGGSKGGGSNATATATSTAATNAVARSHPISLLTLNRDCFLIPVHSIDRFLPQGIPLPNKNEQDDKSFPLGVLEVSDPKFCILAHLMSPLEAIDPIIESPLAQPLLKQRTIATELVNEVQQSKTAMSGMLLANMEKNAEFPFIAYYLINSLQTDPANFYTNIRSSSLSKFDPKTLKYTAAHTLDLYTEVAAICRPPLIIAPNENDSLKKHQTPTTGYIISVFKVFEGDDGERFERNWLYWTGARMLYRYLPYTAGLRRIALHKSTFQRGDKMYLLVCECSDLLKDISSATTLIPSLRARLCGYTGLYRPIMSW